VVPAVALLDDQWSLAFCVWFIMKSFWPESTASLIWRVPVRYRSTKPFIFGRRFLLLEMTGSWASKRAWGRFDRHGNESLRVGEQVAVTSDSGVAPEPPTNVQCASNPGPTKYALGTGHKSRVAERKTIVTVFRCGSSIDVRESQLVGTE
jgi:hypothetical protein